MRFVSVNEGAKIVIDWRASKYTHKSENGIYTVKQVDPKDVTKQYWFMYSSKTNADKFESELNKQTVLFSKTPMMDGYLYSIYTNKSKLSFTDLNYKNEIQRIKQEKISKLAMADFSKFKEAQIHYLKFGVSSDDSDKKLKLELIALKNKMINSADIDSVTWNRYAKYLSWDNRGEEVWKMFDEHATKYPTNKNIMYSKELDRVIGYPNDVVKEKWMSAQIQINPNDLDLLNSYVANFYTDENKEKIKGILKKIYTLDNSLANFKNYIRHLFQYNPEEAKAELQDKVASEDLSEFATQIVWLFADNAEYKKALEWSAFSKDIDFVTKMSWYIETGKYKLIEKEYLVYIAEHPDDYKAKAMMSNVYHQLGRFKESWVLANSLPESPEKEELRKMLNKDVVYEKPELQRDLIAHESELFYPKVLQDIIKEDRKLRGDFVDVNSSLLTNKADNAIQKNLISYSHYDKNMTLHSFSGTYNRYYKLDLIGDYDTNFDNSLIGFQYKITSSQKEGKPQYWSRARIEVDKSTKSFYEFGMGLTDSKDKRFRSAEFNLFPVETAPGMNQKIYQMKLNLYQDFSLFKIINTSISFEGSYYTSSLISRDTIKNVINPNRFSRKVYTSLNNGDTEITTFDNAVEGAITTRFMLNDGSIKRSKLIPFLESQYAMGSRALLTGFPYWMIKNRLYGGGGLGWHFGITNFNSKVEVGYFLDDYSKNFKRLSGNIEYQLFDFTALTFNFELFNQSKYYSNSVQLGIKYNLKRKIKK